MKGRALVAIAVLVFAGSALAESDSDYDGSNDPYSSIQLQEVIDAAMMSLNKDTMAKLKDKSRYGTAKPVITCTPDEVKWKWPSVDGATGLWKRVIESGELKVAGVKWRAGMVADYTTTPKTPSGFWPEYLQLVVDEINAHYKSLPKQIKVNRIYYKGSDLVTAAVDSGEEVDVSEPYYYISGFHGIKPRIEVFDFSCVTMGSEGYFFTKIDSGITTMDQLVAKIETSDEKLAPADVTVGFIGKGNYDSNSDLLPINTKAMIDLTEHDDIALQVNNSQLIAGYVSEGFADGLEEEFNVFPNNMIQARTFMFRKDSVHYSKIVNKIRGDDNDGLFLAVCLTLAVALVILGSLLTVVIVKERHGNPIFMPLLQDPTSSTEVFKEVHL